VSGENKKKFLDRIIENHKDENVQVDGKMMKIFAMNSIGQPFIRKGWND